MRQVHCDGCGFTEPINLTKDQRKIEHVAFLIGTKVDRRWPTEKTAEKRFEADLCPTCQGTVLHNYFDIPAEGELEIPAFIEPRSLRSAG